jgi:hypothetical protein
VGCPRRYLCVASLYQPHRQILTEWQVLAEWSTVPEGIDSPTGLALDGRGNVYVSGQSTDLIVKYSSTGRPLDKWRTGDTQQSGDDYIAADAGGDV